MKYKTTRFFHQGASVVLIEDEHDLHAVSNLYSINPGQGEATEVMKKVVDYADQRGLTLRLLVRQFGNPRGLTNEQLVIFYEKFGFVQDGEPFPLHRMIRHPSQETPAL